MKSPTDAAARAGNPGETVQDQLAGDHLNVTASTGAEHALTGCIVTPPAPNILADALDRVRDDDVADGRYRFIIETVRRMVAEQVPVHPVSVAEYVASHGLLGDGAPRMTLSLLLHELVSKAPPAVMAPWLADRVIEHRARRRLVAAAAELDRLALGADIADLAAVVRAELLAVLDQLDRCAPLVVKA